MAACCAQTNGYFKTKCVRIYLFIYFGCCYCFLKMKTFAKLKNSHPETQKVFHVFEVFFVIVFAIELLWNMWG